MAQKVVAVQTKLAVAKWVLGRRLAAPGRLESNLGTGSQPNDLGLLSRHDGNLAGWTPRAQFERRATRFMARPVRLAVSAGPPLAEQRCSVGQAPSSLGQGIAHADRTLLVGTRHHKGVTLERTQPRRQDVRRYAVDLVGQLAERFIPVEERRDDRQAPPVAYASDCAVESHLVDPHEPTIR